MTEQQRAAADEAMEIEERVPLAPMSTLGVGGSARFLVRARTPAHVRRGVTWARERDLQILALGDGSNVVFGDRGYAGLVLKMELAGIDWHAARGTVRVVAAAGESWDGLVAQAVERGYGGVECLSGIPGRVGAAPIQNIGAYGQELAGVLLRVHALAPDTLRDVAIERADCGLGYRTSVFKSTAAGRQLIVLAVELSLRADAQAAPPRYEELARLLHGRGIARPTVGQVRAAVLELRRRKSMLHDARDADSLSAGSFFVNPVLSRATYLRTQERGRECGALGAGEALPGFELADDAIKVSAAWLIERAGFTRGYRQGPVGLSSKHALAIVNYGGATSSDVLDLARAVKVKVAERFGIELCPEPMCVGCGLE